MISTGILIFSTVHKESGSNLSPMAHKVKPWEKEPLKGPTSLVYNMKHKSKCHMGFSVLIEFWKGTSKAVEWQS